MLGDNQKPNKADTNTHRCYKREDGVITIDRKTHPIKLIDEARNLTKPTEQEANKVKKTIATQLKLQEILKKYKERFQGIGKAKRDGQDIEIHLPMNDNATPIAQKPRRVPYHLLEPLEERINEFVESDIIEKVPEHEAIKWCVHLL